MSDNAPAPSMTDRLARAGITRQRVVDYTALLSGQVGRLIFSVIYFIALARALDLGDFGIFASCSAIGIVLSRLTGIGFVSPLFRVATTRPRLIGAYTLGLLIACAITIPLLTVIAVGIHGLLYTDHLALMPFLLIVLAEVVCWRGMEAVIIVNHGIGRYKIGSGIGISGVALKAAAATLFWVYGNGSLENWALLYFCSLAFALVSSAAFFYPRQRLKFRPKAWFGRARDAIGVSAAEALFYTQSELDKVVVLILGGEALAGLYAIVMRLVDLTAMPLRALSTMLVQWIMRDRQGGGSARTGLKLDALIALVSVAALVAIATLLSFAPTVLGENIMRGAAYLWAVLLVPAFRNCIELHTELLYGHSRMAPRVYLLAYLTALKAILLVILFRVTDDFGEIALWLNGVFALLYIASALVTYKRVLNP